MATKAQYALVKRQNADTKFIAMISDGTEAQNARRDAHNWVVIAKGTFNRKEMTFTTNGNCPCTWKVLRDYSVVLA